MTSSRIAAVITASTISAHFPNRYEVRVRGQSILDILLARLRRSNSISVVLLSTSNEAEDDCLVEWAKRNGLQTSRRDFTDLTGRIHEVCRISHASHLVKIDGSYPLILPEEVDRLAEAHLRTGAAYSYNEHVAGVIHGTGCELASAAAIHRLHDETNGYARKRGLNALRDLLEPGEILLLPANDPRPSYRVNMAVENDLVILEQLLNLQGNDNHATLAAFLDQHPSLMQMAHRGLATGNEVGLEKIVLFPDKIRALTDNRSNELDSSYPISAELSLTHRCNLHCPWCSDATLRNKAMVDLPFDLLQRLFLDFKDHGTRGIVIEGGGEPTLHERFHDIVLEIRRLGLDIGMITNGTLLPYEDLIDAFSWIRISLDASNREMYARLKGADHFESVLQHIHTIAEGGTTCGVGYVLTRDNADGLENLVLTLRHIGARYIHFRPVIDHPEMAVAADLGYLNKYSTGEFTVMEDALRENQIRGNAGRPCRAHSLSTVISADGDVYLCGRLNIHPEWKPIGNLFYTNFHEIWFGPERQAQAQRLLDPKSCRRYCPECRITKYNILFDNARQVKTVNFI